MKPGEVEHRVEQRAGRDRGLRGPGALVVAAAAPVVAVRGDHVHVGRTRPVVRGEADTQRPLRPLADGEVGHVHQDQRPAQPAAGADVEVRLGGEGVHVVPRLDELGRGAVDVVRRVVRLVLERDVYRGHVIGDGVLLGLGEPGEDLLVLAPGRDRGIGDAVADGHIQAGQYRGAGRHQLLDVGRGELLADHVVDPDDR